MLDWSKLKLQVTYLQGKVFCWLDGFFLTKSKLSTSTETEHYLRAKLMKTKLSSSYPNTWN